MRVIEPRYIRRRAVPKSKKKPLIVGLFTFLIVIVASLYGFFEFSGFNKNNDNINTSKVLAEHKNQKQFTSLSKEDFRFFAGNEFQELYERIAYPNTQSVAIPPSITGSIEADNRIRAIAASRGYKARSIPNAPIFKTNTPGLMDDDLLQPRAYDALMELLKTADVESVPLKLNSGYRSIDMQRKIFLSHLQATGVTISQIINGQGDNQVVNALSQVAIPGYSRHHTGYTVDFICANGTQSFETTTCYKWLSKDNFFNAKKYGWIPSYPDESNKQGPEPEPWEYTWVGVPTLLKE